MPEKGSGSSRVSWPSVLLLTTFGVLAAMALTRPGRWVAFNLFAQQDALAFATLPPHLVVAMGPASRQIEAIRLFDDMRNDGDHAAGSIPVPTPDQVAARLSHLDGWTRAIQFELGSDAAALNAAGVSDRMLCGRIAGSFSPNPSARAALRSNPIRMWFLLLLDGQDRQVAVVTVSALRPGFRVDPETLGFVADSSAPGDGDLPAISLFRRTSTGEVAKD